MMNIKAETTKDVALRWGVTPTRVAQIIRAKVLVAKKMGRDWMIFGYPSLSEVKVLLQQEKHRGKN